MLGEDPVASATAAQTHKVRETLDPLKNRKIYKEVQLII